MEWTDLVAQGQYAAADNENAKAEQIFLKALHEAERFGTDDWRVAATLESLGQVYRADKKFAEGESAFRRALDVLGKATGDDNTVQVANVNLDLASLLLEGGRPADALSFSRASLSDYERLYGGASIHTAAALCVTGDSLRATRNFPEAEADLKRCADIREKDGGVDTAEFADALYSLAMTYAGEGKYALADPRFTMVEKIRESRLGLTSPLLARTLEEHAAMLKSMGRAKDADRLLVLSAAIRRHEKKNAR